MSKIGRPTTYKDEYVQEAYKFFDKPLFEKVQKEVATNKGVVTINEERPNMMPTIEGFACYLGIHKQRLYEWSVKHKDLADALDFGRQRMKEFLNYHALQGNYNSGYAKFFAINSTDMVEKKEIEHTVNEIKIDDADKAL